MELRRGGDSTDWFFLAMAHEKLGDKEKARQWYDRATRWMDKNQATDEELRRFRAEATQVLGVDKKKKKAAGEPSPAGGKPANRDRDRGSQLRRWVRARGEAGLSSGSVLFKKGRATC